MIVIRIAINTQIGALMGSSLAVSAAVFCGAHDEAIRDRLFGYNAARPVMALGGFFLVRNVPSFIYLLGYQAGRKIVGQDIILHNFVRSLTRHYHKGV
ncbi:MAG: urea transporter [Nitrospiraceae bacterium]